MPIILNEPWQTNFHSITFRKQRLLEGGEEDCKKLLCETEWIELPLALLCRRRCDFHNPKTTSTAACLKFRNKTMSDIKIISSPGQGIWFTRSAVPSGNYHLMKSSPFIFCILNCALCLCTVIQPDKWCQGIFAHSGKEMKIPFAHSPKANRPIWE